MGAAREVATTAAAMAGGMFVVAGVAKARDAGVGVAGFLRSVGFGVRLARLVGRVDWVVEVGVGVWFLSLRLAVAAAAVGTALALGFGVVLVVAMRRGVAEPCRCFGVLDRSSGHGLSLARAAVLLVTAVMALFAATVAGAANPAGPTVRAWLLGLLFAACVVIGFALVAEVHAFRTGVRRVVSARHSIGGPQR